MTPTGSENLIIDTLDGSQGARIIKLRGPLTLRTLFEFQHTARQEVTKPIVVDIGSVPYMDSAGLGCVISVFASCQRTKRGFALTGLSERIRTLFEITHVDGLIPCYGSVEDAEAGALKPVS